MQSKTFSIKVAFFENLLFFIRQRFRKTILLFFRNFLPRSNSAHCLVREQESCLRKISGAIESVPRSGGPSGCSRFSTLLFSNRKFFFIPNVILGLAPPSLDPQFLSYRYARWRVVSVKTISLKSEIGINFIAETTANFFVIITNLTKLRILLIQNDNDLIKYKKNFVRKFFSIK